jgi:hypothetical protein
MRICFFNVDRAAFLMLCALVYPAASLLSASSTASAGDSLI